MVISVIMETHTDFPGPFQTHFEFWSKPSLITVICMDPHPYPPSKLIATILGDDTTFFFLIISLFFVFFLLFYAEAHYYFIIILFNYYFFSWIVCCCFFSCSGIFRNAPCSGLYRRPVESVVGVAESMIAAVKADSLILLHRGRAKYEQVFIDKE